MAIGMKDKIGKPGKRLAGRHKKKGRKLNTQKIRAALRWWIGTVALTLLPTLIVVIVAALREDAKVTPDLVFNNGELVLSSFLIVTSTAISCYNTKNKSLLTDIMRYILFGTDFIQLIVYTVFKTNKANNLPTVVIVSIASLVISISSSWTWFLLTNEGVYEDESL